MRGRRRVGVLLLLCVLPLAAVTAETDLAALGIQVRADLPWSRHGVCCPVQVTITHAGAVAVQVQARMHGGTTASDRWQHPGGTARRTLLLPPLAGGAAGELHWQLGERSGVCPIGGNNVGGEVALLQVGDADDAYSALRRAFDGARNHDAREVALFYDGLLLPNRWQGYPLDLAILLTTEGRVDLRQDQLLALAAWTRLGGELLVDGEELQRDCLALGARCSVVPRENRAAAIIRHLDRQGDGRRSSRFQWVRGQLVVEGTDQVPVLGFVLLSLLFTGLVGPVNLWWAIRRRRRTLLLVTTPVLSVLACLALLIYNLFSEGIGARRQVEQLVALDPGDHRAAVWTGVTVYAPFGIDAIRVDPESRLSLPALERSEMPVLAADWREGQHVAGGWVPPRTNSHVLREQVLAMRQRLNLHRVDAGWEIVNGLEAGIEWLLWVDGEGASWSVQSLAPGERRRLEEVARRAAFLRPEGTTPAREPGKLGPEAQAAWERAGRERGHAQMALSAPLVAADHLAASDATAPLAWLVVDLGVGERR